mgnify:CR=1 FL=1
MKIEILGGGCQKCHKLAENANAAMEALDLDGELENVTDSDAIMDRGVMVTPALAIDGEVKATGKVLSVEEIKKLLQ